MATSQLTDTHTSGRTASGCTARLSGASRLSRRLLRNKSAAIGLVVLAMLVLVAIFAQSIDAL